MSSSLAGVEVGAAPRASPRVPRGVLAGKLEMQEFGIEHFGPNPRGRRLEGLGLSFRALSQPRNHREAKAGDSRPLTRPQMGAGSWAQKARRGASLGLQPPPRPPRHLGLTGTLVPSQPILPVLHVSPEKDSSHTGLGSILLQGDLVLRHLPKVKPCCEVRE